MNSIIVCGGRDYANRDIVFGALTAIWMVNKFKTLHHGACQTGADRLAHDWCVKFHGFCVEKPWPANWIAFDKAAGPIRNREMLIGARPDLVVAFPGGKGTANMIALATAAGVPVKRFG